MNRLALFDCDGTLVDGQASHCRALQGCFADAGYEPPAPARARRMIGLGLIETMAALLPGASPETHRRLAGGYKAGFHDLRRRGLVEEPLFEGVAELLTTLEQEGWLLGIATGKSDRACGSASSATASPAASSPSRPPTATRPSPTPR